jgi:RND family efflux transporter MFP subunit
LLNAVPVSAESFQMTVQGFGTVQPRVQVQVVPQISGKVIECYPQLVNGGFFKADEPLVVIEQTDYRLAVESASAAVAQAEVQLEKEKAEADVAKKEWEKLRPGQQPDSVLVFRGPQIQSARAQLNAARAQLAKAELDLERTMIQMPFDGRVVSTNVDLGQFITAGSHIAMVYRTDLLEVAVPLEDSELAWFDVPLNGNGDASSVTKADLYANFAGGEHHWEGQLVRTEGQIDPKSRMVHVVAQVKDPFKTKNSEPPLVPGMFVRVEIQGKEVKDIYRLPRYAIRQGTEVWVARGADETKELVVQSVKIVRMDRDFAYVAAGLNEGDFVITSALETVTNGMAIRIHVDNEAEDQ